MRVLAEFRSEVELELAEAEEARAAIGAGLPAEQRDDYAALPLSEALEKFIDFCLEMNRITPTTATTTTTAPCTSSETSWVWSP